MHAALLTCAGVGLAAAVLVYALLAGAPALWAALRGRTSVLNSLPWIARVDRHLKRRRQRIRAGVYVVLVGFAACVGLVIGAILKNPLAAVLMAAIAFVLPEQLFLYMGLRKNLKKFDQLVDACALFAVELTQVGVAKALENAGRGIPDPVGRILRQTGRDLTVRGDHERAFERMLRELDFSYGREFVLRVIDCYHNLGVAAMFTDLGREMEARRKRLHKAVARLFFDRLATVVTLALFFPAYLIADYIAPTTWQFLTTTAGGKLCVATFLLSVLLGPLVDYGTLRRVEV